VSSVFLSYSSADLETATAVQALLEKRTYTVFRDKDPEAGIVGGEVRTSSEALDVRAFAPESIPWPEIAFKTTWWALVDWLAKRRPDLPAPSGARWSSDSG